MDKKELIDFLQNYPDDISGIRGLVDVILKEYHVEKKSDCQVVRQGHEGNASQCRGDGFEVKFEYARVKRVIIVNQSKV